MATITTVLNIVSLKALSLPADGTIIYVEGYFFPGDAGGGMFRFDQESMTQPDLGINFIPNFVTNGQSGRWVRQYTGFLNVAYFGFLRFQYPYFEAPSGPKNHERLQDAINYCHRNSETNPVTVPPPHVDDQSKGDFTIYFPQGVYWLQPTTPLILRSRTHLKGDSTTLIRLHDTNINYLFNIDVGSIQRLTLETLKFDLGAEINGRRANPTGWLHAKAERSSGGDNSGGIYGATLKNIFVENVGNHGVHFEGGEFSNDDPFWVRKCNQFIYSENVWVERRYNYLNSFRITGLNVNMSFINCNPTMPTYQDSIPTMLGAAWYVDSILPHAPGNNESIIFSGCDAGGAPGRPGEFGFYIRNSQSIVIENSWIENSENGIYVKDSQAVSIIDNHFANAAANGSLPDTMYPTRNGACIITDNSVITVERNHVGVTEPSAPYVHNEQFIRGIGNNNVINSRNNTFTAQVLSQTFGIAQYVNVGQVPARFLNPLPSTPPPLPPININGIMTGEKKVVMVQTGLGGVRDIYRINSTITAGETIYLFAENGNLVFHAIGIPEWGGKNIGLGGLTTFTLNKGHGATFIKVDGINGHEKATYQLMATV